MAKRVTANQHYVPQFYLKQFADSDGNLQKMSLTSRRIHKPRPCAAHSYDRYFYGIVTGVKDNVSQEYERMLGEIESRIALALPNTIQRLESRRASDDDFPMLSVFMASQWLRTMYYRERLSWMHINMLRKVSAIGTTGHVRALAAQLGKELTDEDLKNVREGGAGIEFNNLSHLQMLDVPSIERFARMLLCKTWNIIRPEGRLRFITSDNPVAEWSPLATGMCRAGFLERKHYFALTPTVLIECIGPAPDSPIEPLDRPAPARVEYRIAERDETLMFDMLLARRGGHYCYSSSREEFTAILGETEQPTVATAMYKECFQA